MYGKGLYKNVKWSRQEIIELIGDALGKGDNGSVGNYPALEQIALYDIDRSKRELAFMTDKVQLLAENLVALLDHLGLEIQRVEKKSQLVVKKKKK